MVKTEAGKFLLENLKLNISEEKTKITNLATEKARFLGIDIIRPSHKESKVMPKVIRGKRVMARVSGNSLHFFAPMKEIYENLKKQGFVKPHYSVTNELIPKAMTR